MVNNGYDQQMAEMAIQEGDDLVAPLKQGGPFNAGNQKTWYGGGAEGFTDYPTLCRGGQA